MNSMVTLTEIIVSWNSSLHDLHMMYVICTEFNDGAINKRSDAKKLARTIKTFEYKNTRNGVKCCDR